MEAVWVGSVAIGVGRGCGVGGASEVVGCGCADAVEPGQGPLQPVPLSVGLVAGPGLVPTCVVPGPLTCVGTDGLFMTPWLGIFFSRHIFVYPGGGDDVYWPGTHGVVDGDGVGLGDGLAGMGALPSVTGLPQRAITQNVLPSLVTTSMAFRSPVTPAVDSAYARPLLVSVLTPVAGA